VIPSVLRRLVALGVEMLDPPVWKKGSMWVVDRDGGLFTTARYLGLSA
jgi:hypothetical protein